MLIYVRIMHALDIRRMRFFTGCRCAYKHVFERARVSIYCTGRIINTCGSLRTNKKSVDEACDGGCFFRRDVDAIYKREGERKRDRWKSTERKTNRRGIGRNADRKNIQIDERRENETPKKKREGKREDKQKRTRGKKKKSNKYSRNKYVVGVIKSTGIRKRKRK